MAARRTGDARDKNHCRCARFFLHDASPFLPHRAAAFCALALRFFSIIFTELYRKAQKDSN
jgi:hypothetical protein